MNCRNCGGAMELFATRGYFFCRYCGSFDFPRTTGDDGVRVLGDDSEAKQCAVCAKPLASALLDESHPVRYCRNCRGILIARSGFATVVQKRRAWALDQPGPAIPLDRSHLERKLSCPMCNQRMETHPYFGPGNVVIDSCAGCELVWLDFGELKQIVAAPGKDRGTREQVLRETADTPVVHLSGVPGNRIDVLDVIHVLSDLF
ncbi:MAG TPA: zf-TFIIB domain-containing protein [Vicinamibacterales bacterium]|nr:zf-TFIIB domain-containing protein [Vicinamibacterales bacterium]